uniref:SH2 domain containing adaptor protein B n=1 Tax=Podarcis muralis TaxID=64176 RepID=A0A670K980_PODMU
MAKWLNKYFSLGNNKTKSPPQPPRPDYRDKRNGTAGAGGAGHHSHHHHHHSHHHTSPCFPRHDTSDLLRAYRAQKERDFEDPYSGPGSSLRKLRALCRAEYCAPEELLVEPPAAGPKPFSSASCCGGEGGGGGGSGGSGTKKEKVLIADDYSDPFDAKSEGSKTGKGENTGYMEPYEAQRIMTEFQRQDSVKPQQKDIQLYDTPYEPEGNGVESDSESVVSQRLRESKLPQDDDRPADEYDQPWEWNKVSIPALAAQFNGGEMRQSSPSPSSNDRRRQLRAPGGGFKPIKHGSPEFCGILGERVDPTIPLEKQIWYHGAISRTDAENLLRLCKECSYLVRNSQTSKHDYSLSLKSNQGFMHMKLAKTKEKYILGQNSPPFDSVPEVIHYYTAKKLPIKGAEHLSLLYPVAVRTL